MTQRDMAGYLGVSTATIRNWRKEKPNLYKIIMQGFAVEDVFVKAAAATRPLGQVLLTIGLVGMLVTRLLTLLYARPRLSNELVPATLT